MRARLLAFGLTVFAAAPVPAQEALYGAQPPPGAAFIRFVNAGGAAISVQPGFAPSQLLGVTPGERVSAYAVVADVLGRDLVLSARQGAAVGHAGFRAEPGSFVTLVIRNEPDKTLQIVPVVEQAAFNQARARLAFYNATPGCAAGSLTVEPRGLPVFSDVPPGTAKMRAVNPVAARLQAKCADTVPQPVIIATMASGNSYSVWLMLPDGHPVAFATQDETLPYRP